jgi:hypothetical protein
MTCHRENTRTRRRSRAAVLIAIACASLWIVTKKDGEWGVQARSSFAP